MRVGVGRITLEFFNNDNLALKHRKLEELCHDLRRKYNVSALEVAEFDDAEQCVIGFAAVIPDFWETAGAHGFVRKICDTIDETAFARVMSEDTDLLELE